jgi:ELWxxDGT repeat protein
MLAFQVAADVNCDGRNTIADVTAAILVSAKSGRFLACPAADAYRGQPVSAADLGAILAAGFDEAPPAGTPTPTPRAGILDIGPLFGVPGSVTQASFDLTEPFTLGTIRLEIGYDEGAFEPLEPPCQTFQTGVEITTQLLLPGLLVADLTPEAGSSTSTLEFGTFLSCSFDVIGTTGDYPLDVRAVFTPAEGEPEEVRLRRFFDIQCAQDENCPDGQFCDGTRCVPIPQSSFPEELTVAGDTLYFSADDLVHGRELWASDGTAAGTRLVVDLFPGSSSGPRELADFGGSVAFVASSGLTTEEIYRSDGAAAGTHLLASFFIGNDFLLDRPCCLRAAEAQLYFVIRNLNVNIETLWRTGLLPGTAAPVRSFAAIEESAVLGDLLFFAARESFESGLWVSDGSSAGTRPIDTPDFRVVSPRHLTAAGGRLFFLTGSTSETLWSYDPVSGQLESTALGFASIFAGGRRMAALGDTLFLSGPTALLRRETWGAVSVVRNFPAGGPPSDLVAAGERLFFLLADLAMWSSDGSEGGTAATGALAGAPLELAATPGAVLFAGLDGLGTEPWRFTGGQAERVADIHPGDPGSDTRDFVSFAGAVYFAADDGRRGRELWRSDGTTAGTRLVVDIAP